MTTATDTATTLQNALAQAAQAPESAAAQFELGLALGAAGQGESAVDALRRAVSLQPDFPAAWYALSEHLTAFGEPDDARLAVAEFLRHSAQPKALKSIGSAICANRLPEAEFLLREYLRQHPDDCMALRMLAEITFRLHRDEETAELLTRCLALDPSFPGTQFTRALTHYRAGKTAAAHVDTEAVLASDPASPSARLLLAAILTKTGDIERTLELYDALTREYPSSARMWMSYGHVLKAYGKQPESIVAYRRTIELDPVFGEAWWSLANLKTVRFNDDDVNAMLAQLKRRDLSNEDRLHFEFALGKALEDLKRYEESFHHYAEGNRLRLEEASYDPDNVTVHVRRCKQAFTRAFFAERAGVGNPDTAPIFIVGLPRAGSTLLEQILSSHSLVEGTMELPYATMVARTIAGRQPEPSSSDYLPNLPYVSREDWHALGEQYLQGTLLHRKLGRPYFIDKMPNNFGHVGLIHLMLPNARIIDARRHPMGSCFSNFKQHFALGQLFAYGLEDIGHYYRDYVELMAHFDSVLPGRVHRVHYERMVEDTENEVRRLLDYCGLPFEEGCLRFYQNDRVVRTASSEQVRRPIYKEGVDHWRNYEPWLDPLKAALGPVLTAYPEAPEFLP
jgi:tetratricopeptide (TPR) repeat protein